MCELYPAQSFNLTRGNCLLSQRNNRDPRMRTAVIEMVELLAGQSIQFRQERGYHAMLTHNQRPRSTKHSNKINPDDAKTDAKIRGFLAYSFPVLILSLLIVLAITRDTAIITAAIALYVLVYSPYFRRWRV